MINGDALKEYLYQPEMKAGDVLLFSEGTVHGALPWTAEHERRVVLYRFSPSTVAYGRSYYPSWPEKILKCNYLSDPQRAVLEPPFANRLDRKVQDDDGNILEISRAKEKKDFDKSVFGVPYF